MSRGVPVVLTVLALFTLTSCEHVRLGAPQRLWLLWLVPMLLVLMIYAARVNRRLLEQFAAPDLINRVRAGLSLSRRRLKGALLLLGLTFAVLSLAEFKMGFTWENVQRSGVDVVIALDVSDSMLVEDAGSTDRLTRLERAKREIRDLLRMLEGDRIGLVAFAGAAFLECPLTLDYGAAEIFLADLDTELIPVKGTAIDLALEESLRAFEGAGNPSKAIILITDGEDHSGRAVDVAEKAKKEDVRVFTIGIGRDEGAPIPAPGGGFRRDRNGELVLSKLDEATLQKIALTTQGRYVRSVTGDMDLEQIYRQGIKATLESHELGSRRRQRWEERFQWFLAVALLAWTAEAFIGERPRRRRRSAT